MTEQTTPIAAKPLEELQVALTAARLSAPVVTGPDQRQYAVIPPDFVLQELKDRFELPPRAAARVTVDERASLSAYANRFSTPDSVIIADFDALTVAVHLDWHPDNTSPSHLHSGPGLHSVTLKLRPSEEFDRWNKMQGKLHSQEDFARFLEENSVDITWPEATTMIEISRDLEATVGQTYKSSIRLDNGDRAMRFETESKVTNNVTIPDKFTLSIPIYNGEAPSDLTAKFRWKANGGGGLLMGFEWHRVEYQRRAHFAAIAAQAAEETGLPVFIGRI